jgi:hypothetical protein
MTMLTAAQLTSMRSQVETLLPDTGVIQVMVRTSDSAGGWTEAGSAVSGGTVACRLDPLTERELSMVVAAREALGVRYRLTMPHDAPLAADYQVVTDGHTYQVIQLDADHSCNVSRRAIIEEIR